MVLSDLFVGALGSGVNGEATGIEYRRILTRLGFTLLFDKAQGFPKDRRPADIAQLTRSRDTHRYRHRTPRCPQFGVLFRLVHARFQP